MPASASLSSISSPSARRAEEPGLPADNLSVEQRRGFLFRRERVPAVAGFPWQRVSEPQGVPRQEDFQDPSCVLRELAICGTALLLLNYATLQQLLASLSSR